MANSNYKILLVEDDLNFGDVLCSYLEMHDYDVELAADGVFGFEAWKKGNFELLILDVNMPRKDGFTLATEIRERDLEIPIIFLTAKNLTEDEARGFKSGADDYIKKPFSSELLLARIAAVLKRTAKKRETKDDIREYRFGRFRFDYALRTLHFSGENGEKAVEKLSPKEASLLRMFLQHLNDVTPRSEALNKIWHEDTYFTARSMDVFVTKLRKYLSLDPDIEIINIHGNGFQFLVREGETQVG
jgi:two-component system, OmpR family, response regulator